MRLQMCSADEKWKFLLDVKQNRRRTAKISIHFQENKNFIQLSRIDYNTPNHKNPAVAPENLPQILLPYVGQTIAENHIHIFVEKEKPLAWAMPLSACEFPVKALSAAGDLCYAVDEFLKMINLQTEYGFEGRLIL